MINKLNFKDKLFKDKHAAQIQEWVEDCYSEFVKTTYFENLDDNSKDNALFIINGFFDYSYCYFLVSPDKISNDMLEEIMLDIFPRKISADKETFVAFESIMISFLLWCQEYKILSNVDNICSTIKLLAPKMIELSQDSSNWGMAKSFLFDKAPDFNLDELILKELMPVKRESSKVGRNDICNCGSGKKYKKCCGSN